MPSPVPPRHFAPPAAFATWLKKHHGAMDELLVGFYRKDSGKSGMTYPEALDEALCWGWIDGVRRSVDADSYSVRFTPRKPTSKWSHVNLQALRPTPRRGPRPTTRRRSLFALQPGPTRSVFVRAEEGGGVLPRPGGHLRGGAGRLGVLRAATAGLPADRDALGDERQAPGDPETPAGRTDHRLGRGTPAPPGLGAAKEEAGVEAGEDEGADEGVGGAGGAPSPQPALLVPCASFYRAVHPTRPT